jgi:prophage regulatory protein
MDNDRYLTVAAVSAITTLSRATIERKVAAGEMPSPIYISQRRKAWRESAVRQWMADRETAAAA